MAFVPTGLNVDNVSLSTAINGLAQVKDVGISTAKIADGAVTDAKLSSDSRIMRLIQTQTLSGDQASITFSSIPSGYKHLYIEFNGNILHVSGVGIRFNSDSTSSHYRWHAIGSNNDSTCFAHNSGNDANLTKYGYVAEFDSTANNFFNIEITNLVGKQKYFKSDAYGCDASVTTPKIYRASGFWTDTADEISQIDIIAVINNTGFASGSVISLYGMK